MFAFVVYAMGVWYAAGRWRRRWGSFASVGCGLAGLLLVAYLHYRLNDWSDGQICMPVLQSLLYPYTALVVFVGLFICFMPRPTPPNSCAACGYDLAGLDEVGVCPECGSRAGPLLAEGEDPHDVEFEVVRRAGHGPVVIRVRSARQAPGPAPAPADPRPQAT